MKKKYLIFDFNGTLLDDKTKELFNGVHDMLEKLSKRYKLLLSSKSNDEDIKDFLKEEGVYKYFDIVFGSSVREKGPKHIEVFELYLDDQDFANRTVYIGDTDFDRNIAKDAGMSFIKIGKEGKDYYEINNISELEEYLKKVK